MLSSQQHKHSRHNHPHQVNHIILDLPVSPQQSHQQQHNGYHSKARMMRIRVMIMKMNEMEWMLIYEVIERGNDENG